MKKILALTPLIGLILLMTSCVSTKKIVYFQGSDSIFAQAQDIMQQYEMKLKPADQILIKLTCSEPELLNVFAQDVVMGTAGIPTSTNITSQGNMTNAYAYTVTNDGYIILPAVGRVKVEGSTTDEAAKRIEEEIQKKDLIKDPGVTVRLLNGRVAVIGAVKTPQVVNLTSERNTILDVLAKCGDVDDTGLRRKVCLYREEKGKRMMFRLDLTKADIFSSPAYYVQQNDMIYVEPNKSKNIKNSAFYTFLGVAGGSIFSLASVAISVVALTKK
ncbi:MAG: polysaccharide biosynthesis/export family protein [Bacteroidaceae bacterium]